jgi:hypothetical protein
MRELGKVVAKYIGEGCGNCQVLLCVHGIPPGGLYLADIGRFI